MIPRRPRTSATASGAEPPGIPDARLFPYQTWRRLLTRELHADAEDIGVYADPAGHLGLRQAIARHVGTARGVSTTAEDVVVTNATQQAVDVVARVLLAPGARVAVEDPGYRPPRRLLASLGARVTGVPVDDQGLVVDAIPAGTRLVYVTPSHQFPLGMTMPLPRRLALLDWAERHDAAIVEDDYDSEFRYGDRPIEPLQTLDTSGRVIYIGSFSKTMLPTLRLGFVIAPPSLRRAVRTAKFVTDWHTTLPAQAALARFIDEGYLARHVRKMRQVYQAPPPAAQHGAAGPARRPARGPAVGGRPAPDRAGSGDVLRRHRRGAAPGRGRRGGAAAAVDVRRRLPPAGRARTRLRRHPRRTHRGGAHGAAAMLRSLSGQPRQVTAGTRSASRSA